MERRVESSSFSPNHGGGSGGGGYFGRRPKQEDSEAPDEEAKKAEEPAPKASLSGDVSLVRDPRASSLSFGAPPPEPDVELQGMQNDLEKRVRVLHLATIQMEKDLERRQHAEEGQIIIDGSPKAKNPRELP